MGSTIVYVSHNKLEMQRLCQRIAWIKNGRLVKIGKPDELISEYVDSTIKK
jgi:ABC-type polysaccharide/polyol phosphate transport system ATPase subunit